MSKTRLLITCEHGGNKVPAAFAACFRDAGSVLATHRGYDPGSLALGSSLANRTGAMLISSRVTRLLVDLNRSLGHRALFSEFTSGLDPAALDEIVQRYYRPHRQRVQTTIAEMIETGSCVVHVGVHSFTPELNGQVRKADVGLLYDPARQREQEFCANWRNELRAGMPRLIVRRNYPYLGRADGFTTWLRREFDAASYLGIELEVNQSWLTGPATPRRQLSNTLANSLQSLI